jgi:hypothetical protein
MHFNFFSSHSEKVKEKDATVVLMAVYMRANVVEKFFFS